MLTNRQEKTFQYIQKFINEHHHSPTTAEIAKGIGIKSRGVVHRYIQALVAEGLVELIPDRRRNIKIIAKDDAKKLPVIGKIAARKPLEAIPEKEVFDIAERLLGNDRYALTVKDDSMAEEGILKGDVIICEKRDKAKNGEIVVAMIDDQEIILRQYRTNNDNMVILRPAHSRLLPLVYEPERVKIQGIMVALVRL